MSNSDESPTCFIAMPITTHPEHAARYGDENHWRHVMETLFEPAVQKAGFKPIKPQAQGAHLIHDSIIKNLSSADLVLVDFSSHNPNVFFEFGVRTSLNLPVALTKDEHTDIPFDASGINTHEYSSSLNAWDIEEQRAALSRHIRMSHESCDGENPLWRRFGMKIKAYGPSVDETPLAAALSLMTNHLDTIQSRLDRIEFRGSRVRVAGASSTERGVVGVVTDVRHGWSGISEAVILADGTFGNRTFTVPLNDISLILDEES